MAPAPVQRWNLRGYGFAAGLVLAAVLLEIAVRPFFGGRTPQALFTIAVTLAASYGGLGPGILATALTVGCVELLFAKSIFSVLPGQPSVMFFAAVGVGISVIIETFRRRNRAMTHAKEQLEAANRELAQRSENLAQSNEELKRLAYALSHDLQNPLRTVSLFTERLAREAGDKLDDDARTSMQFILESVHQAQEMVRRLLEYSVSAHQGRIESTTDLNTVLEGALDDVRAAAEEGGARIIAEPLPIVRGDAERLRQVFLNLLSNAIKYRGDRPPEIHVAARNTDHQWTISVRDNGIGIDMQYAEKIFGLFERLHSSKHYEGTGIGLSICRSIVQRHGGRIWVESKLGQGSTFSFTLPMQPAR